MQACGSFGELCRR